MSGRAVMHIYLCRLGTPDEVVTNATVVGVPKVRHVNLAGR